METATGKAVEMPDFGNRDISGVSISRSENLIRVAAGSPTSPGDLYMHQFGEEGFTRLTHALNHEIAESDLVAGEVIRYPSYDGLEIPAILAVNNRGGSGYGKTFYKLDNQRRGGQYIWCDQLAQNPAIDSSLLGVFQRSTL